MTSVSLASQPFYYEVVKVLLGAFAGAGLALLSNQVVEWCKQRRANLVAGNLALVTLNRQGSDFVGFRKAMRGAKAAMLQSEPNAPKWAQYKPILFPFSDDLRIDFQSLAFLLEGASRKVFNALATVELRYSDLKLYYAAHNETTDAIQEKLAGAGLLAGQLFNIAQGEALVGARLIGKALSNVDALELRFAEDEQAYLAAMTQLREALVARYSDREIVKFELVPGYWTVAAS